MESSEVRDYQKNNVGVEVATSKQLATLQLEESMDFETIGEQNLPVLTEGSAITSSPEGEKHFIANPVLSAELQDLAIGYEDSEATKSIDINVPVVSTLLPNEQKMSLENVSGFTRHTNHKCNQHR